VEYGFLWRAQLQFVKTSQSTTHYPLLISNGRLDEPQTSFPSNDRQVLRARGEDEAVADTVVSSTVRTRGALNDDDLEEEPEPKRLRLSEEEMIEAFEMELEMINALLGKER
jgi:hypothetical protein